MILFFVILFIQFFKCFSKELCSNNLCYYYNISHSLSYDESLRYCKGNNLTLAIIDSVKLQNFIKNGIGLNNITDGLYFGLEYVTNEFKWAKDIYTIPNLDWVDPINIDKDACAFITVDGKINMGNCSTKRHFICSNDTNKDNSEEKLNIGNCPTGFFKFVNYCYKMNFKCSDEMYTWHQANEKCASSKSSLVTIDSFQEQEFITALMTISPSPAWTGIVRKNLTSSISLWINNATHTLIKYPIRFKKGEPNGYLTNGEHCLMIYSRLSNIGYFNDETCDKFMNFICKTVPSKDNSQLAILSNPLFKQGRCKNKYYEFNETCYSMDGLKLSFQESNKQCQNLTLKVYNDIHIAFMRSLMAFVGVEQVWISVFEPNGSSNGAIWLQRENNSDTKPFNRNDCYYMSMEKGLGTSKPCDSINMATSCYYYLPGHEEITQDSSCPLNWMKVGQKCFKVVTDFKTFPDAVTQCKAFNGQLASLKSMKEVQAVNVVLQYDAWFGISGETYLNNTWLDGTPIEYCLFRHTVDLVKLIKNDPKKKCFVIRSKKSEWNDENCEDSHSFVCEMPTTKYKCSADFPIHIDGDCFGTFTDELTWSNAEASCHKKGGEHSHLVSFHNMDQENEVFSRIPDPNEYWIGLKQFDFIKMWIDGTVLNYQRNYMSNYLSDLFTCFTIARSNMESVVYTRWSSVNCQIKRKYICRISSNGKSIHPTQPPFVLSNSFCPSDFFRYKNSCFKIINETHTWTEADKYCSSTFSKNTFISRLASFASREEFDFVLSRMRDMESSYVWIGLYRDYKTSQIVWIDEKPLTFLNLFELDYSNSMNIAPGNMTAMYVSSHPFVNGNWRLVANLMNLPFICRIDPYLKSNPEVNLNRKQCPPSYIEYNGFCYSYNSDKMTFQDSYNACKNKKSDLLVLTDTFEEHFIRSLLADQKNIYKLIWMGFKVDVSAHMMMNWVTPKEVPVYYTHWKHIFRFLNNDFFSDEDPYFSIHGCYFLNVTTHLKIYNPTDQKIINNVMIKSHCDIKIESVCKMALDPAMSSPVEDVTCATSRDNISYDLDVTKTKKGDPCIRWDIAETADTFQFKLQAFLYSSLPFNKDGYISYSLNRCSEFKNKTFDGRYSCFVFKNTKYSLEECEMKNCSSGKSLAKGSNRMVLVILIIMTLVLLCFCALFFYRKQILSNYRIRSFLAHSLGRYQPDCLRDPHRPHTSVTGGVGFSNPVYTALESKY